MIKKLNIGLIIIFFVLTLVSTYLSLMNKIFALFALSMGISMFYSIVALTSSGQEGEAD